MTLENLYNALKQYPTGFTAVVSNPPYQIDTTKPGASKETSKEIYHIFQQTAIEISNITSMIYPRNWVKNIEKSPGKEFIENGMKKVIQLTATNNLFTGIRKNYPLSIVLSVKNYNSSIIIDNKILLNRNSRIWISNKKQEILIKRTESFKKLNGANWLLEISNQHDSEIHFYKNGDVKNGDIRIYIKKKPGKQADGEWTFASRKEIEKYCNNDLLNKYKVCTQSRIFGRLGIWIDAVENSAGNIEAKVFNKDELSGMTWAVIKTFNTEAEAKNFCTYINNKIITELISLDFSKKTFASYVPDLEDYTDSNPYIDWSQPLDPQLYKIFNLTQEEINIIEDK